MAILTGPEILKQIAAGTIVIDPFDPALVNPNSVDVRLGDKLRVYKVRRSPLFLDDSDTPTALDPSRDNPTVLIPLTAEGCELIPGVLYLAHTLEYTHTNGYVPTMTGKSTNGRLGISVHITAGHGEHFFTGDWTLEITVVHPVVVRPGMRIGQLVYHTQEGTPQRYEGRYQGQRGPVASRLREGK